MSLKALHATLKILFILALLSSLAKATEAPATLKYDVAEIFKFVLEYKNHPLQADIPLPTLHYASSTSLKQFQDAIEPQWGFRPDLITNAYVSKLNEIYLLDEVRYYEKTDRCMDDSLAHELTHYVQDRYQHFDLNDESLEWDAVSVQSAFRDKYCPQKTNSLER